VSRRAALRAALALTAALAGCGGDAAPSPRAAVAPAEFFGINGDQLYQLALHGQYDTLGVQLDGIAAGGLAFVRSPANWGQIEPAPVSDLRPFDFSTSDAFVGALATRGLRWHVLGQGTPEWAAKPGDYAACSFRSAPASPGFMAAYLGGLAVRYGRDGSFWSAHPNLPYRPVTTYEVSNEPNLAAFWCPRPDPVAYARTLVTSARAVHAIDPQARVELGGLAAIPASQPPGPHPMRMSVQDFLAAVVAAEPQVGHLIDAVAVHPYARNPDVVVSVIQGFRRLLQANGMGKVPIDVDEVGWSTVATPILPPTPEDTRAGYLAEVTNDIARMRHRLGVIALAPYAWITAELDPTDPNQFYGVADPQTGEPYPAGSAYIDAVAALTGRGD
jgi:hypothetical protein